MSLRDQLLVYIRRKYKTKPERLWMRYPGYAVFRHADNQKWFAIVMDVERHKLGLDGEERVDILNVKLSDPLLVDLLTQQPGFFSGYHMNRSYWVSILLDGTVPIKEVCRWLEESYMATASSAKKQKLRPPKEWIVPANPKYFDIEQAFENADEINWKQGAGIKKGDTVYMYVAAPVSAILYKCTVTQTDIPYHRVNPNVRIKSLMRIRLQKRYAPDRFTFERLGKEYGIHAVRGPRGVPQSLSETLRSEKKEK